ncbi:GNAT family N-acetyltransferase [Chitinophaga ginsengisoli]|uniref:Acetyltransferase (GNAT) family protein n=1 Tax=Chitinophaga ginsengisoli TaxID=363837 RepID=A0A2P8FNV6_9BACT|nr:GNAT family N-acetyltransferase [Chitinophaga ginsengisoli]PSL23389.1 acetyltransferase (GNAT) family protein [Chitinophaga ginsengisoli]
MRTATSNDKPLILDILCASFDCNISVNAIIPQDARRTSRIRALMDYAFEQCYTSGKIFINPSNDGCALVLHSWQEVTTLRSIWQSLLCTFRGPGISMLPILLKRQKTIKEKYPYSHYVYLWFIGVIPSQQNQHKGAALLDAVIDHATSVNYPILLETSIQRNVNWYEKSGFDLYQTIEVPHQLYLLKRELTATSVI